MKADRLAAGTWIRLMKTYNLILRRIRRAMPECTLAQFDVLAQLERRPDGISFRELSQELLVTAGNLTGIVDRLEREGLVVRSLAPHDRRSFLLHLTDTGRALAKRLIAKHRRDLEVAMGILSEQELIQLRDLLEKLQHGLEER